MKIEIRNVKYAKFASQETECFEATVLIDGKVVGKVSNEGHGGNNMYYPHDVETTIDTYAKTLPPCKTEYGDLEMSSDLVIGELFTQWLLAKDLKNTLKTRALFLKDGKLLQTKKYPKEQLEKIVKLPEFVVALKAEKVLNNLPFDEALSIFVAKVG
jgi:hypothetical protein